MRQMFCAKINKLEEPFKIEKFTIEFIQMLPPKMGRVERALRRGCPANEYVFEMRKRKEASHRGRNGVGGCFWECACKQLM